MVKPKKAEAGGVLSPVDQRHAERDFFLADLSLEFFKCDQVTMEFPIFSLKKTRDIHVVEWSDEKGNFFSIVPSVLGRATMQDKNMVVFLISKIIEGVNRKRIDAKNRVVQFVMHDFLVVTGKGTGGKDYRREVEGLKRLKGTQITTNIWVDGIQISGGFGLIEDWKTIQNASGAMVVRVTLSEWLLNQVLQKNILTISREYFSLAPLQKRIYELGRKHCGKKPKFKIGLALLQKKCGSTASINEFRRAIRTTKIPDFVLSLDEGDMVVFLSKKFVDKN